MGPVPPTDLGDRRCVPPLGARRHRCGSLPGPALPSTRFPSTRFPSTRFPGSSLTVCSLVSWEKRRGRPGSEKGCAGSWVPSDDRVGQDDTSYREAVLPVETTVYRELGKRGTRTDSFNPLPHPPLGWRSSPGGDAPVSEHWGMSGVFGAVATGRGAVNIPRGTGWLPRPRVSRSAASVLPGRRGPAGRQLVSYSHYIVLKL